MHVPARPRYTTTTDGHSEAGDEPLATRHGQDLLPAGKTHDISAAQGLAAGGSGSPAQKTASRTRLPPRAARQRRVPGSLHLPASTAAGLAALPTARAKPGVRVPGSVDERLAVAGNAISESACGRVGRAGFECDSRVGPTGEPAALGVVQVRSRVTQPSAFDTDEASGGRTRRIRGHGSVCPEYDGPPLTREVDRWETVQYPVEHGTLPSAGIEPGLTIANETQANFISIAAGRPGAVDGSPSSQKGSEFVPNRLESGGGSIIGQQRPNAARTRRDDLWMDSDAPLPEDAPPGNDEQWSSGLTGCLSVSSPAAVRDRSRLESRWRQTKTGFSRGKRDGSQPSTWQSMTEPAGITTLVGTREGRLCTAGDRGEHDARRAWLSLHRSAAKLWGPGHASERWPRWTRLSVDEDCREQSDVCLGIGGKHTSALARDREPVLTRARRQKEREIAVGATVP
ncbi:hypothetical protein V8D89_008781 [Ganoderma adspersum]